MNQLIFTCTRQCNWPNFKRKV